jgi:WhiB family redox-sensing transcriptional regulator
MSDWRDSRTVATEDDLQRHREVNRQSYRRSKERRAREAIGLSEVDDRIANQIAEMATAGKAMLERSVSRVKARDPLALEIVSLLEVTAPDDGELAEDGQLHWKDQGLCRQTDPEVFFPEKGRSTKEAKAVCRRCPVREDCLETALAADERFGIWGGLSERERRRLKKGVR